MSDVAPEVRPLPDIISIESQLRPISGDEYTRKLVSFPPSYRLIVTTTKGVYSWDMNGVTELFRSRSEGIVAARKLTGHDEMLAVADSQVVILHDIKKGMQRSYRLKGNEVLMALYSTLNISNEVTGPSPATAVRREVIEEPVLHD